MGISSKKINNILIILIIFFGLIEFFSVTENVVAQAGNAYDLINGINDLRIASGLPPYTINAALMSSAQSHADWILATGQGGHVGVDGTYAIDRAILAGYGSGASVSVNENWARGYGLSVYDCIYVSWDDPDHMGNMLSTWHDEIGAGVSISSNNQVTYVVNIGHVTGNAPTQSITSTLPQASIPITLGIKTSTPNPDGGIVHIVSEGEFLVNIASAYGVSLMELLQLNGLNMESAIFPGDRLIIKNADENAIRETKTPAPTLTATIKPSYTSRASLTPYVTATHVSKNSNEKGFLGRIFNDNTKYFAIGLIAVSLISLILLIVSYARIR